MTSNPLFSFRGIYGNTRLPSLDSGTSHAFDLRSPGMAQRIFERNASVCIFVEHAISSWTNLSAQLPGWDARQPLARTVAWNTNVWTFVEMRDWPQAGTSKDVLMVKLYYMGNPNWWCWFVSAHPNAGYDSAAMTLRSQQGLDEIAAVASLGTDRWIFYSDQNEYIGGPGDCYTNKKAAGWMYHQEEPRLQLANRNFATYKGWPGASDYVPIGSNDPTQKIDYVYKSSKGVHALKHTAGEIVPLWGDESDHNWICLTTQVIR